MSEAHLALLKLHPTARSLNIRWGFTENPIMSESVDSRWDCEFIAPVNQSVNQSANHSAVRLIFLPTLSVATGTPAGLTKIDGKPLRDHHF